VTHRLQISNYQELFGVDEKHVHMRSESKPLLSSLSRNATQSKTNTGIILSRHLQNGAARPWRNNVYYIDNNQNLNAG